jgi:hypothetical protein
MPQEGHATQDCERAAGKRWLGAHAAQVAPHGVTFLGDDLSSNQPLCALGLPQRCTFILTCKPDSHPKFSERVAFWHANDAMAAREEHHWNGRFTEVTMVRYLVAVTMPCRSIGSTSPSSTPQRAHTCMTTAASPIIT